jgi:TrmH family RNA methyltransferase
MRTLSSRDNPLVKRLHALAHSGRERRRLAQTLLDGAHLVRAALDAGRPLRELVVSDQGLARDEIARLVEAVQGVPRVHLPDALFARISPVDAPSGVLAVIDVPAPPPPIVPGDASLLVLDAVQDAGNLGTMLRTAAAAGLSDVLLSAGCAQAWSPRVLRAGMGAHFCLNLHEHADAAQVLGGYRGRIVATALGADTQVLYDVDLRGPVAWLFGAEGRGLSPGLAASANVRVRIPMPGAVESLNVAAAAAICLFEQVRQQRGAARAKP